MTKKFTTKKAYTMEVLTSNYVSNIGTNKECINSKALCEAVALEMDNNWYFYNEVRKNTRRSIHTICWNAFTEHVNNLLKWQYGDNYFATSDQLKAFINNDYSVLNSLYEEMENERFEYQMEIEAERKAKNKYMTKVQAERLFRQSYNNWKSEFLPLDIEEKKFAWDCYIDMLNKDGKLSDKQVNNWVRPQFCQ